MSKISESIKSAAILFNNDEIYAGVNHAIAIRELEKVHPDWHKMPKYPTQEGFLTSTGRFVDRLEATEIAESADQLNHLDSEQKTDAGSGGLDSYHLRH